MNHRSLVERESERQYRLRSNCARQRIDNNWFGLLNPDDYVSGLDGYCLDALDHVPCGGMASLPRGFGLPTQVTIPRGLTLSEHQEQLRIVDELIDEILAEDG